FGIHFGRCGEVEETVAAEIFFLFQLLQALAKRLVSLRIAIVAGVIVKVGSKFIPSCGIDGANFGDALSRFADGRAETFVAHWRARNPYNRVTLDERI